MHISLILLAAYMAKCLMFSSIDTDSQKEYPALLLVWALRELTRKSSDQELNKDRRRVFLALASDGNFYVCWKILSMKYLISWSPLVMLYWCIHDQTEDMMVFFFFHFRI